MILFFLCLPVCSSPAFDFTALLNIQVKVRARNYFRVGGTEFGLPRASPHWKHLAPSQGVWQRRKTKTKNKKTREPPSRKYQFCPRLILFSVTRLQFLEQRKVLNLNSSSDPHSNAPWPYPGHFISVALPPAPSWLQTATLQHSLLTVVWCVSVWH